jgi:putative addiction module component (TIGR02574 family)
MNSIDLDAILELDLDDRIALAQAIWDSVAAENPAPQLDCNQKSEIERRIAEHMRDPSTSIPWDTALARLRERYG